MATRCSAYVAQWSVTRCCGFLQRFGTVEKGLCEQKRAPFSKPRWPSLKPWTRIKAMAVHSVGSDESVVALSFDENSTGKTFADTKARERLWIHLASVLVTKP